jgi:hypothetical protein
LTRIARVAAAVAAAAALAGCGDDGERPPQGPPQNRHGGGAIERFRIVELARARLVAASDLTALGRRQDAAFHFRRAARLWTELSPRVRESDPVLEREVSAAFARVADELAHAASFDQVRDRLSPLANQLLEGVVDALVPRPARADPGVKARVLLDLLGQMEREYALARRPGAGVPGRLAQEHAWTLLGRSQAVARAMVDDLGPQRETVVEGLKETRELFPAGAAPPPSPAPLAELRERLQRVRRALTERFGIGA